MRQYGIKQRVIISKATVHSPLISPLKVVKIERFSGTGSHLGFKCSKFSLGTSVKST